MTADGSSAAEESGFGSGSEEPGEIEERRRGNLLLVEEGNERQGDLNWKGGRGR